MGDQLLRRQEIAQPVTITRTVTEEMGPTRTIIALALSRTPAPAGTARPLLALTSLLDPSGTPLAVFTTEIVLTHLTRLVGSDVDAETVTDALTVLHRPSLATLDTRRSARTLAEPVVRGGFSLRHAFTLEPLVLRRGHFLDGLDLAGATVHESIDIRQCHLYGDLDLRVAHDTAFLVEGLRLDPDSVVHPPGRFPIHIENRAGLRLLHDV